MPQISAATVAAFLGVLTAGIGTWIAWQQHRATRSTLRLDLYDRRFAVYLAANVLLSKIVSNASYEIADLHEFNRETAQAEFLFREDLVGYLGTIRDRALAFRINRRQLEALAQLPEPQRAAIVNKDIDDLNWFTQQLTESRQRFRQYLRFEEAF